MATLSLFALAVPQADAGGFAAIVDYSSRTITLTRTGETFPVAVPYTKLLWRTGIARVTWIEKDPDWIPTENIRRRKLSQGVRLKKYYRPYKYDKSNPLGPYMIHITFVDYPADNLRGIHGTNEPTSIGQAVTSGCFRNYNWNIIRIVEERLIVGGDLILFRI